MGTKYQDFDVSLDSSLCLPFPGADLNRPPTPVPPRTKRKNVTFAAPLEEVVQERLRTYEALAGVTVTTEPDELEYLESIHDSDCLGKRFTSEAWPASPLSHPESPLSMTVKPLALLSSPSALCQSPKYPTEVPPSTAARSRQKHRARDTSSPPPLTAESTRRGSHLNSIMAVSPLRVNFYRAYDAPSQVLDEIHSIIKGNIQTRFERFDSRAVELRRQIVAQTQADMTALLDE